MQIAMATRDRRRDVTPMPADVAKIVMDVAWCNRGSESLYSTASVVLCTLERGSPAQSSSAPTFKCPSVQGQAQLPSKDYKARPRVQTQQLSLGGWSPRGEIANERDWR